MRMMGVSDDELSDELYEKILDLTEKGDEFCEDEEWKKAIKCFEKALALVPEPKDDWETSTWIYAALADAYFFWGKYEESLYQLNQALMCPDGLGNPFITLRLAQCNYELGNMKKADEYFFEAYMLEGMEIFKREDKYKEYAVRLLQEKGEI